MIMYSVLRSLTAGAGPFLMAVPEGDESLATHVSEKGEALLRGVLTLRLVSHAQPARLWKAAFYI